MDATPGGVERTQRGTCESGQACHVRRDQPWTSQGSASVPFRWLHTGVLGPDSGERTRPLVPLWHPGRSQSMVRLKGRMPPRFNVQESLRPRRRVTVGRPGSVRCQGFWTAPPVASIPLGQRHQTIGWFDSCRKATEGATRNPTVTFGRAGRSDVVPHRYNASTWMAITSDLTLFEACARPIRIRQSFVATDRCRWGSVSAMAK